MPASSAEERIANDEVLFELRRIDITRTRGVVVIVVYTSCAIFIVLPGCVIIFRSESVNVLADGHNHELDLV
jgi:hypothetical protein